MSDEPGCEYDEPRWEKKFRTLEKSFVVFQRRIDEYRQHSGEETFQLSLIKSFGLTAELAWQTLKDYLKSKGTKATDKKYVIRHAFQSQIISNAEGWIEAIKQRKRTALLYDEQVLKEMLVFIDEKFYPLIRDLYRKLKEEKRSMSNSRLVEMS